MKSKVHWSLIGLFIIAALLVASCGPLGRQASLGAESTTTGAVTTITAISSVESSGTVKPQQSASVFWQTTGLVDSVNVKPGDIVSKGDTLMALDPSTAPQSVLQAQADLISAQNALEELLHPTALSIASAEKAVADAEEQLRQARRDLGYTQNPVGDSLYESVEDSQLALETAQANLQLAAVSSDAQAYEQAVANANVAFSSYQDLQAKWDAGDHSDPLARALEMARGAYQSALDAKMALELRINTDKANQAASVEDAQTAYDRAVANLNAALGGPDSLKVTLAQADMSLAEATLADAQDKLDKLTNGADPDDIQSAEVRVQLAQAALDTLILRAPFAGEALQVNYLPGDSVDQSLPAVVIANRAPLHVEASVDESEVSQIEVGDSASLTLDALPSLTLAGTVTSIDPIGEIVQGLVQYTVRVDIAENDPRVLIGMTANVSIVTDVQEGALAVPVDAVQVDDQGEYVNRVGTAGAAGGVERVPVVSGAIQEDVVVVSADLQPGDMVQIIAVQPATNTGGARFGGG